MRENVRGTERERESRFFYYENSERERDQKCVRGSVRQESLVYKSERVGR